MGDRGPVTFVSEDGIEMSSTASRRSCSAIDRASQNYTGTELYTDPAVKAQWEQDVLEQMPELVGRNADGDEEFFTDFATTLQKPVPPESVKAAQVEVEKAEAAKIAERIKVLGQEGYLKQYAIDHGLNSYQPTTGRLITDTTP